MMETALITGGGGRIGSAIAKKLETDIEKTGTRSAYMPNTDIALQCADVRYGPIATARAAIPFGCDVSSTTSPPRAKSQARRSGTRIVRRGVRHASQCVKRTGSGRQKFAAWRNTIKAHAVPDDHIRALSTRRLEKILALFKTRCHRAVPCCAGGSEHSSERQGL